MEPRHAKSATPDSAPPQQMPKARFKIVKLEERIAPSQGGVPGKPYHFTKNGGCYRHGL